jgi:hypothetical protein
MRRALFRILGGGATYVACLALTQCGGKDETHTEVSGPPGAAGSGQSGNASGEAGAGHSTPGSGGAGGLATLCNPNADSYQPTWMPPKAIPGACTPEQIAQDYTLCQDSKTYDKQACRAFNEAPANGACLGCLFTTLGSKASGPALLLQRSFPVPNIGGCVALLDGDESDTSCGALTQAASLCEFETCLTGCPSDASAATLTACFQTAIDETCASYIEAASCVKAPRYVRCHRTARADYFAVYADLFCGAGPPDAESSGGAAP